MSTKLQVLVSMICHLATYMLLGLGSIYENGVLTFLSLVTLALGLFFGKEVLERLDLAENMMEELFDEEIIEDTHLADILHKDDP